MAVHSYVASLLCALGLFSLGSCSLLFGESREASDGGSVTSDGGQDGIDAAVFDAAVFDAAVFDASPACVWRQDAMGWWRAEDLSTENTATDSSSSGSHHGTKAGDVSYSPGKVGNAFYFPGGAGRIQILDPARVFYPNQSFSMELWVKRAGNAGTNPVLISQNECGGALPETCPQQSHWWLKFQANNFAFVVSRGDGTPSNAQVVTTGVGYSDNVFHHVVIQRDTAAAKLRIYVDGEDKSNLGGIPNDLTVPDLDANDDDPMYIGAISTANTWAGQFEGLIDEVAYYNYVLTPQQVSALYAETNCP